MMSSEEESEELDPRIRDKLEELNHATDTINHLEKQFEESNAHFRMTLNETSSHLRQLSLKLGPKYIEESRPYYEIKEKAVALQQKCQRAAVKYERACQLVTQAKDTITVAEQRFNNEPHMEFDSAWQEMLNHATGKLMDAEEQKSQSESEHRRCMQKYLDAERQLTILERKLKRVINKSMPYFEESSAVQTKLNQLKSNIEHLSKVILESKKSYSLTLKDLEMISEEIHEKRAQIMVKSHHREPGVGAEQNANSVCDSEKRDSSICESSHSPSVPQLKIDSHLCQLQVFPRLSIQSLSPPEVSLSTSLDKNDEIDGESAFSNDNRDNNEKSNECVNLEDEEKCEDTIKRHDIAFEDIDLN